MRSPRHAAVPQVHPTAVRSKGAVHDRCRAGAGRDAGLTSSSTTSPSWSSARPSCCHNPYDPQAIGTVGADRPLLLPLRCDSDTSDRDDARSTYGTAVAGLAPAITPRPGRLRPGRSRRRFGCARRLRRTAYAICPVIPVYDQVDAASVRWFVNAAGRRRRLSQGAACAAVATSAGPEAAWRRASTRWTRGERASSPSTAWPAGRTLARCSATATRASRRSPPRSAAHSRRCTPTLPVGARRLRLDGPAGRARDRASTSGPRPGTLALLANPQAGTAWPSRSGALTATGRSSIRPRQRQARPGRCAAGRTCRRVADRRLGGQRLRAIRPATSVRRSRLPVSLAAHDNPACASASGTCGAAIVRGRGGTRTSRRCWRTIARPRPAARRRPGQLATAESSCCTREPRSGQPARIRRRSRARPRHPAVPRPAIDPRSLRRSAGVSVAQIVLTRLPVVPGSSRARSQ